MTCTEQWHLPPLSESKSIASGCDLHLDMSSWQQQHKRINSVCFKLICMFATPLSQHEYVPLGKVGVSVPACSPIMSVHSQMGGEHNNQSLLRRMLRCEPHVILRSKRASAAAAAADVSESNSHNDLG